ncbi:hypothetical protein LCGC14_1215450 [marine sediment metagenome]|uniref:Uncharacterized protein n=1 Tax=marine sediment metagenome TaxID=412755 RepID=A0A0F9LGX1_9ZZZZ
MVKQIPSDRPRGFGSGENGQETNTDYLNRNAEGWEPPMGEVHMHLIYKQDAHWRIVSRGSSVCRYPGRCYKVTIHERMPDMLCNLVRRAE